MTKLTQSKAAPRLKQLVELFISMWRTYKMVAHASHRVAGLFVETSYFVLFHISAYEFQVLAIYG